MFLWIVLRTIKINGVNLFLCCISKPFTVGMYPVGTSLTTILSFPVYYTSHPWRVCSNVFSRLKLNVTNSAAVTVFQFSGCWFHWEILRRLTADLALAPSLRLKSKSTSLPLASNTQTDFGGWTVFFVVLLLAAILLS